jgi:hypothetical protein
MNTPKAHAQPVTPIPSAEAAIEDRLLLGYIARRAEALQEVVDTVPVFGKRYNTAVDEMEEVEELLEILHRRRTAGRARRSA